MSFLGHRVSLTLARYSLLCAVSFTILSIHFLTLPPKVRDYADISNDVIGTRLGNHVTRFIHHGATVTQNVARNSLLDNGLVPNTSLGNTPVRYLSVVNGNDERKKFQTDGTNFAEANGGTYGVRATQLSRERTHNTHTKVPTLYAYNCTNIHQLSLKRKIGGGSSKQVFLAKHDRRKVAVKMVTPNVDDVTSCMRNPDATKGLCYKLANAKLMKEILLLQQLCHPNLLRMFGFCARSEEVDSTSLRAHGVIAVYEYGLPVHVTTLQTWPPHMRISTAIDMSDLLDYFEKSPLGSLRLPDFKETDFMLCEGRIKLTDLDDATVAEPNCHVTGSARRKCAYGLTCIGGVCPGYNAKYNMDHMNRVMFSVLLSDHLLNPTTNQQLADVRRKLNDVALNAKQLKVALRSLLKTQKNPTISLQML